MKSRKLKIAIWTVVMVGILGTAIMLLWNWLIPSLLGLPTISFLQSLGLFVLSRILFGGFGHFGRGFGHRENSFRKKWEQMSPEKRQEFLERRARFGFGHHRNKEQYDEESRTEE